MINNAIIRDYDMTDFVPVLGNNGCLPFRQKIGNFGLKSNGKVIFGNCEVPL